MVTVEVVGVLSFCLVYVLFDEIGEHCTIVVLPQSIVEVHCTWFC